MSTGVRNKILALKIRLLIWWGRLERRSRIAVGIGGALLGALILGAVSYGAISYFRWNSSEMAVPWIKKEHPKIPSPPPGAPRTEPAPINGILYTKEEADRFMNRRPLAIMINNHTQARPQFGLSKADLVYEAVAEGGITRFLALFHAQDCEKIGPVRSARVYYEDWAAEFNAWYAHWGGAYMDEGDKAHQNDPNYAFTCNPEADSYAKINRINLPSLDQMWLGKTAYWRDRSRGVATEHTGYTSTEKLWNEAPRRYPGWEGFVEFDQWKFKDDTPSPAEAAEGGPAQAPSRNEFGSGQASTGSTGSQQAGSTISFNFWETPGYEVRWEYDAATNSYKRFQGGELQVDAGANETPIMAKNVILQFTKEGSFGDKKHHLKYETVGTGSAKIFLDGRVIEAIWKKEDIRKRTKFYDLAGQEVVFNRGQIWIEIIPARNADSVQIS